MAQPILTTNRLILNQFTLEDVEPVTLILQNKAIADTTARIPYPYEPHMAKQWFQTHEDNYQAGKSAIFAIRIRSSNRLIGTISLVIDQQCDRGELGYWIREEEWGQGYCTEAGKVVIQFGFEQLNLNKIKAEHMTRNKASGEVLEKLGFKKEGHLKQHFKKWGVYEDVAVYSLCRCEYNV